MFYVGYDNLSFWYDRWTLKAPFCEQVPFVNIQDIQMRVHDVYIEGRQDFNHLATISLFRISLLGRKQLQGSILQSRDINGLPNRILFIVTPHPDEKVKLFVWLVCHNALIPTPTALECINIQLLIQDALVVPVRWKISCIIFRIVQKLGRFGSG